MAELVVSEDLGETATELFVRAAPRLVALAGGRTPARFYERLATADLGYGWTEVELLMGDERCVPADHPDSNERMVRETLLSRIHPGTFHGLAGARCDPAEADRRVAEALRGRALDVAVLGLGADGHTASLFPGDPALEERERQVVRVEREDHPRLTLTLPVLSSAGLALFLASGEEKREAVHRLLEGGEVPAARVRAHRVVVVADPAAGG